METESNDSLFIHNEKDLKKISKQKQQIVQETGYKTAIRKDI